MDAVLECAILETAHHPRGAERYLVPESLHSRLTPFGGMSHLAIALVAALDARDRSTAGHLDLVIQFGAREVGCRVLHTGEGLLPHTMQWNGEGMDGDASTCRRRG